MAITVRSVGLGAGVEGTTLTITKPSGLAIGDFMLAECFYHETDIGTSLDFTTPAGWTLLGASDGWDGGSYWGLETFWKFADSDDAAAASFDFTVASSAVLIGAIAAMLGVDTDTPIGVGCAASSLSNPITCAGGETPAVDYLLVVMGGQEDANTGSSASVANNNPSWTEQVDEKTNVGDDACVVMYTATYGYAQATGTVTLTFSATDGGSLRFVALMPSTLQEIEIDAEISIGQAVTASKLAAIQRTAAVPEGLSVSAERAITTSRLAQPLTGFDLSATTRLLGIAKAGSISTGFVVSAIKTMGWIRNAAVPIGLAVTAERLFTKVINSALSIGMAITAYKGWEIVSNVAIGIAVTASRSVSYLITASVAIGQTITASRLVAWARAMGVRVTRYWDAL